MSGRAPLTLVSLNGAGTQVLLWGYVATIGALAVWSLPDVDNPWPTVAGIAVLLGVGALLSLDRHEPLLLSSAIIVAVSWTVVAAVISWHLLAPGGHAQWYFGAGAVSLFLVSLRGRLLVAWLGFAAMSAVILIWSATTAVGIVTGILLVGKQLPILLVGVLFTVGLRRATKTITRLTDETEIRAAAEAADRASADARAARLAELDAVATPLLQRLVDGRALTESDRVDFAVAEAALRDGMRARSLAVPAVVDAAARARRRGAQVVLLDDRYPSPPDADTFETVVETIVAALDAADGGRVVARLLPEGRDDIATVLRETAEGRDHVVIPALRAASGD